MSLQDTLLVAGVIIVGVVALLLPVLRVAGLLCLAVAARSLTDVGTSTSSPVLPAAAANGALAALFLVLALTVRRSSLSVRLRSVLILTLLLLAGSAAVGLLSGNGIRPPLEEAARLLSVVAVLVLASRRPFVQRSGALVILTAVPATVVLLAGFFLGIGATIARNGRAAGTFSHPNAAAAFLAVVALGCLAAWLHSRRRSLLVLGSLALLGIGLTASLGGLAGFLAGAAVLLLPRDGRSLRHTAPIIVVLLAAVGAVAAVTGLSARLGPLGGEASGAESLRWRFLNWELLLDAWADRPWFGYGLGSTTTRIMPMGGPPHSMPVQILVESGVMGMGVVVLLVVLTLRALAPHLRRGAWEAWLLLVLMVFVALNGSESNLLNYTGTLYLLALVGGSCMARLSSQSHAQGAPGPAGAQVPSARSGGVQPANRRIEVLQPGR